MSQYPQYQYYPQERPKSCWFMDLRQPFCGWLKLAIIISIALIAFSVLGPMYCKNDPSSPIGILFCTIFPWVTWIVESLGWLIKGLFTGKW